MVKFNNEAWRLFTIEQCPQCGQAVEDESEAEAIYEIITDSTPEEVIARVYSPHNAALIIQANNLYQLVDQVIKAAKAGHDLAEAIADAEINVVAMQPGPPGKITLPPGWLERAEKVFKMINES